MTGGSRHHTGRATVVSRVTIVSRSSDSLSMIPSMPCNAQTVPEKTRAARLDGTQHRPPAHADAGAGRGTTRRGL
jgi:hypothetical protein